MKLIGSYSNGNYSVSIYDDGTKIRVNKLDCFLPEKPESIDLKITNRCDQLCPMCHEDSIPDGKHGNILNLKFLDTMLPFSEIAIGGGNPLTHPDLITFLYQLKDRQLIANMTVNQVHFIRKQECIHDLVQHGLIHGLGVSVKCADLTTLRLLEDYSNAVVHVIAGVIEMDQLKKMFDRNLKLLILGYKDHRRGVTAHNSLTDYRMGQLYDALPELIKHFKVVSFDNLAIKQLRPQRLMNEQKWAEFYMGEDGQFTMYIDAVQREFSCSSTSTQRWPMMDDIKPMFDQVRIRRKDNGF